MKIATALAALLLCSLTAACMPTASSTVAIAAAPTPADTRAFVEQAVVSNTVEIETSRLALASAARPDIRAFAKRMIRDHTRANAGLAKAASASGVPVPPPSLDAGRAAKLQTLRTTPPVSFDAAYVAMQAEAHQDAISLFTSYAANGSDPALVAFARRTLPTLRMHAAMLARLGGGAPVAGR
jgi:putative membrane protein